jgi:hypothetical protein
MEQWKPKRSIQRKFATQLFDELCIQFPGRFTRRQYKTLLRRVNLWRQDARARGVVIGRKKYRRLSDRPRERSRLVLADHWDEMAKCLEERGRSDLRRTLFWDLFGLPTMPRRRLHVTKRRVQPLLVVVVHQRGDDRISST